MTQPRTYDTYRAWLDEVVARAGVAPVTLEAYPANQRFIESIQGVDGCPAMGERETRRVMVCFEVFAGMTKAMFQGIMAHEIAHFEITEEQYGAMESNHDAELFADTQGARWGFGAGNIAAMKHYAALDGQRGFVDSESHPAYQRRIDAITRAMAGGER